MDDDGDRAHARGVLGPARSQARQHDKAYPVQGEEDDRGYPSEAGLVTHRSHDDHREDLEAAVVHQVVQGVPSVVRYVSWGTYL